MKSQKRDHMENHEQLQVGSRWDQNSNAIKISLTFFMNQVWIETARCAQMNFYNTQESHSTFNIKKSIIFTSFFNIEEALKLKQADPKPDFLGGSLLGFPYSGHPNSDTPNYEENRYPWGHLSPLFWGHESQKCIFFQLQPFQNRSFLPLLHNYESFSFKSEIFSIWIGICLAFEFEPRTKN